MKCEVYLGCLLAGAADYCKMQEQWWAILPTVSLFYIGNSSFVK